MPSLAAICASNAAFSPSYTPVAVFVDVPSGIGQGIADAFARQHQGSIFAHHIIIGRNQAAAESIISQFPKPTSGLSSAGDTDARIRVMRRDADEEHIHVGVGNAKIDIRVLAC